jgi:hypothetical protein
MQLSPTWLEYCEIGNHPAARTDALTHTAESLITVLATALDGSVALEEIENYHAYRNRK